MLGLALRPSSSPNGKRFALDATGEQIRAAIRDVSKYASGGFLLPGTAGARINASARSSVAMERQADGTYGYSPHNLLTYSEDFSNAAWAKTGVTVTADAATSPAGTVTADRIAGGSYLQQDATVVAGGRYTGSAYLKADAATTCTVTFGTGGLWGGDNPRCTFDLSAGTAGTPAGGATAATIETVGNGWYRCAVTAVCAVSGTTALRISTGVFAWGGQWNLGPVATAYIPTTSAAVFAPATSYDSTNGWGVHGEAARTNLARWNADMSNAAWALSGTGAAKIGAATALGALPMYRINVGTTGGAFPSDIEQPIALSSSTTYTVIAIVRAVSGTSAFRLGMWDGTSVIKSADMSATTTPQVFAFTGTTGGAASGPNAQICAATAGGVVGDIEVGGFSVIAGSVPATESIILTYGSTVTRAADMPLVPLPAGLVNMAEGLLVVEGGRSAVPDSSTYPALAELSDGTLDNRHAYYLFNNAGAIEQRLAVFVAGGFIDDLGGASSVGTVKSAYGFKSGDVAFVFKTGIATTSFTNMPAVTQLTLGHSAGGINPLGGRIYRIRLGTRKPSNAAIQGLSA